MQKYYTGGVLLLVLYVCEMWSLTFNEKYKLQMFKKEKFEGKYFNFGTLKQLYILYYI